VLLDRLEEVSFPRPACAPSQSRGRPAPLRSLEAGLRPFAVTRPACAPSQSRGGPESVRAPWAVWTFPTS